MWFVIIHHLTMTTTIYVALSASCPNMSQLQIDIKCCGFVLSNMTACPSIWTKNLATFLCIIWKILKNQFRISSYPPCILERNVSICKKLCPLTIKTLKHPILWFHVQGTMSPTKALHFTYIPVTNAHSEFRQLVSFREWHLDVWGNNVSSIYSGHRGKH